MTDKTVCTFEVRLKGTALFPYLGRQSAGLVTNGSERTCP